MKTWEIDNCKVVMMPLIDTTPISAPHINQRQREQKTLKLILRKLGLPEHVGHKPDGSPYIDGYSGYISISHSQENAVIAITPDHRPGIDTETWRAQLERVKHKFLSPSELTIYKTPQLLLKAWCMKEAAYKAAGIRGLHLIEGISLPISPDGDEIVITPTNQRLKIYTLESTDRMATILCLPL